VTSRAQPPEVQAGTFVREIEAHYAAYLLDHSDALSRRALLNTAAPAVDHVVVKQILSMST
jgi:hypothetical protein